MLRWIVVGLVALAALFFAQPDQARAVTAEFLGANHRQDGYVDFNGDRKTDIFRTTGTSWWVSYGGTSSWQKLATSDWQLENGLCFGDFNGNGKTDVFLTWNGDWRVAYDGTAGFTKINSSGYAQTDLAFGDFDGDGRTDVFVANGADWYVSYSGTSSWTKINGSDYKTMELAFGDFDGDGKTDVLRADGKAWYVSYGGTSGWTKINSSSLRLGWLIYNVGYYQGNMGLGDFDGDGKTDIFKADGSHWYVSYGGTSSWKNLKTYVREPDELYFADFDGNGRTDIFKQVWGPPGWMVWFNEMSPYGGSDMVKEIIYPTGPPPDLYPPVISDVKIGSLTPTSAIISWTTDEPATSRVQFGVTQTLNQSVSDSTLTTNHRLSLTILGFTELIPDTLYYYQVGSNDAVGHFGHASGTFTTPPLSDTTPPVISAVQAINITSTSATITWTTDENSSSQVEFGLTTSYGSMSTLDSSLVTGHSQSLNGLAPNTLYHYRVLSRDAAGNLAVSSDHTFTTAPQGEQFSDVSDSPYRDQINDLANRGVISGYPDGTFRPKNPVIRQQFAKMIAKALELPVSTGDISPFADVVKSEPGSYVDPSDIYYPDHYVAVCAREGITVGKTPTSFAPYDNISRAQLITMVARAANLADPPAGYNPPFNQFDDTHYPFARRAAYGGLLAGLQGLGPSYDFFGPATRGEVCLLLYNLLHS